MSEQNDLAQEGLTLPAAQKEDEATVAHAEQRLEEHKALVGDQFDPERDLARQESALGGASLTEEQEKEVASSSGDEKSSSITGSTAGAADTSGVASTPTPNPFSPSDDDEHDDH